MEAPLFEAFTTTAACEADRRCGLYRAKDLSSKERIAVGCSYIKGFCGQAFTCYANKLTGARAMANAVCETAFPEWEYTPCTDADDEAVKVP